LAVKTLETSTEVASGTEVVPPFEVTMLTELTEATDGELTNSELETTRETPDWVTDGVDQAGAGV
jgi:hypothetical protein